MLELLFYNSNYFLIAALRSKRLSSSSVALLQKIYNAYVNIFIGGVIYLVFAIRLTISYSMFLFDFLEKKFIRLFSDTEDIYLQKVEIAEESITDTNVSYPAAKTITSELSYDYLKNRLTCYINPILESYKTTFLLWNNSLKYPPILEDKDLSHFILNSAFVSLLQDVGGNYEIDFSQLGQKKYLHTNYIFELKRLYINKSSHEIKALMQDGKIYSKLDHEWNAVKIYIQCAIVHSIAFFAHNWSHLLYPDLFAGIVYNTVHNNTNLYALLEPHIRFTMQVQHRATKVQQASGLQFGNDYESLIAWLGGSMHGQEFIQSIINSVKYFYSDGKVEVPDNMYKDNKCHLVKKGVHTFPSFKYEEISIVQSYKKYHTIIRNFVGAVFKHLSQAEVNMLEEVFRKVQAYVPTLAIPNIDRASLVADLIFQSSLHHSWEHTLTYLWGNENSCIRIRKPFSSVKDIKNIQFSDVVCQQDLWKTRGLLRMFARYNQKDNDNQTMDSVRYKFNTPELKKLNDEFLNNMLAAEKELDKNGNVHVKLENTATSISF